MHESFLIVVCYKLQLKKKTLGGDANTARWL